MCTTVTVRMYAVRAKAKRLTHCVCCLSVFSKAESLYGISRSYRMFYILYLIMFFTEPHRRKRHMAFLRP